MYITSHPHTKHLPQLLHLISDHNNYYCVDVCRIVIIQKSQLWWLNFEFRFIVCNDVQSYVMFVVAASVLVFVLVTSMSGI